MSDLKLTGTVKVIYDTQTWDSGFSKREFVITTNEQYPQEVKFEAVKDKCAVLDKYKVGQGVEVAFNVRGNEYNGKYYVNLQAWKINEADVETPTLVEEAVPHAAMDEEDDLPF